MNEHKCPICNAPCSCENMDMYGDCSHDCQAWKNNPEGESNRDWRGAMISGAEED